MKFLKLAWYGLLSLSCLAALVVVGFAAVAVPPPAWLATLSGPAFLGALVLAVRNLWDLVLEDPRRERIAFARELAVHLRAELGDEGLAVGLEALEEELDAREAELELELERRRQ